MPNSLLNTKHSQPPTPDSPLPDFVALAATLQTTAQAILRHCEQSVSPGLQESEAALSDEPDFACSEDSGETRCYRFSPSTIRHERELLKKYHAEDFRGLIAETHVLLVGMVKLMKSVHPDARMRGYVISSLGCLLEQASTLTLRMQNVYSKVELVDTPATL